MTDEGLSATYRAMKLTRLDVIDICNALGLANESWRQLAGDPQREIAAPAREVLRRYTALIKRLHEALDHDESVTH